MTAESARVQIRKQWCKVCDVDPREIADVEGAKQQAHDRYEKWKERAGAWAEPARRAWRRQAEAQRGAGAVPSSGAGQSTSRARRAEQPDASAPGRDGMTSEGMTASDRPNR